MKMTTSTADAAVEVWRDVPSCPGYQASSLGRVRSTTRKVWMHGTPRCAGHWRNLRGKVLSPGRDSGGYLFVGLGQGSQRSIHLLVTEAFHGPKPDGHEACHADGDKWNNRPENLRWDTSGANKRDTVRHGTHVQARKTHCARGGHRLEAPNLVPGIVREGRRSCLACKRAYDYLRVHPEADMQIEADRYYAEITTKVTTWDSPGIGSVSWGGGRR